MMGKKMGMRGMLTHLLGIVAVACALVAVPGVAHAETATMPDGKTAEVLPLKGVSDKPVQITESGRYVLRTAEGEVTPAAGYTIDVSGKLGWVQIYIDGTVYVNPNSTAWASGQRWLFNIKQASNIEFIGVNDPCVSFKDKNGYNRSTSGFLTDRYYESGYKNAEDDISVSFKVGDNSGNFLLWYSQSLEQVVPAISLGNTTGKLTADFQKLKIRDYTGDSRLWAGRYGIYEYAVPVRLFRANYDNDTNQGNCNPLSATFTDCVFYDISGDYNGAVSLVGNSNDKDATSNLTATFNNCEFSGYNDEGIWQTGKSYPSAEETEEFAKASAGGKYAVAGVMGVSNATVNLNNTRMANFHSTRSSDGDTLTVDALNVGRSARCNINGGEIKRYGAKGNTCLVYAAGALTLDGEPMIASYHKNASAGNSSEYTDADVATGTAKSIFIPKKAAESDGAPALNLARGFKASYDPRVLVTIAELEDESPSLPRVLGFCKSVNRIDGLKVDGPLSYGTYTDEYQVRDIEGKLTLRDSVHEHKWKIVSDGLGVKASCVGTYHNSECPYGNGEDGTPNGFKTASYKLSMSSETPVGQSGLVYDGCPVQISMDDESTNVLAELDLTAGDIAWYSCKSKSDAEAFENGTKLDAAPTDAGNYYVVATFESATGSKVEGRQAFKIVPRTLTANGSDGIAFTLKDGGKGEGRYLYTGESLSPAIATAVFTTGSGEVAKLVEGTDFTIDKNATGEHAYGQVDPGVYTLIIGGKGNFGGSLELTWEIVDARRFDLDVSGYKGVYDGNEHGITVAVKNDPVPADLKIEYKTSDSSDWTDENPTFKNAVTRTVSYRVTATDYLMVTGKAVVEISRADQQAPTGLVAHDWTTCSSKDGSISGVTKAMEYRRDGSSTYTKISSGSVLSGLSQSGKYYVRYAGDYNHNESPESEVTIKRGPHAASDKWKQGDPGQHYKPCKYCKQVVERESCRWVYKTITPATPGTDGVRQKVCRVCGIEDYYTGQEAYTYADTYAPVIYGLWEGDGYCKSVSFDVIDDRDETVTVTDNGVEIKADKDGRFTVKAAAGDDGAEHVIVATDAAGNAATRTIKMYAEHDYRWIIDREPTVSEPGSKHGTCTRCGHGSGPVEIPAMTVKGYSGVYDGKAHAVDASGLPKGATVAYSVDNGTTWLNDAPSITGVGSQEIMFRVTVDGATVEGKAKLEVMPRKVTVTAQDASKTYGEADPELAYTVSKGSLVEGESLAGISVTRQEGEDVREGGYTLSAAAEEGSNPNYALTFKTGTFTIKPKTVGIAWSNTEFVYDGEIHVSTATATGVVDGDDVALTVKGAARKAGEHAATVTGIQGDDAGNYALPKSGLTCDFTIKRAPQGAPTVQAQAETVSGKHDGKITGVDASMEWRAENAAAYAPVAGDATELTGLAPGTYRVRYAAGENHEASADTVVTIAAGRKLKVTLPSKQVGYKLTANETELDWHQKLTLKFALADGYYKTDSFAIKVNGELVALAEDDSATVVDIEKDAVVTVEGIAKHEAVSDEWYSDENGHWHTCTCGDKIDEAEHTFEWVIDKKPTATEKGSKHQKCSVCGYETAAVEIPAASVAGYEGEYDGAFHSVDASNLPAGVNATYSIDGGKTWSAEAPQIKNAGMLTVDYRATVDGACVEGQVELKVNPRKITVAAVDASKTYGDSDPYLDYHVTEGSLVKGESLEKISVLRDGRRTVGSESMAAVQPEGANANYAITFKPGTFTVKPRVLTVTWGTSGFVYDGTEKVPAVTLGNIYGDDKIEASVAGAKTDSNAAGEHYTATVTGITGDAAANYALPTDGLTCDFTIRNAEQGAPVVQVEAETVSGKHDGKITGVDATMEYRAEKDATYKGIDGGKLENLAPGVYCVRYRAKANHDASPDTTVTVVAGRKLKVALPSEQVGYTLTASATELDWHQAATLTFNLDSAYFASDDFAVKVNGKAVKLAADGIYMLSEAESDVNVTVEGILKHEPDGSGWKNDETSHWHICRCGDEIDKAAHDFAWVVDKPATASSKGSKHQECTVCGRKGETAEIAMLPPTIVEGTGQKLTLGAAEDLTFRSDAPFDLFVRVLVDGKELDEDLYELHEGSTVVTLKASCLATLKAGEHELAVESETGTASTTFVIEEPKAPATDPGTTTTTTTTVTMTTKKKAHKRQTLAGALAATGDDAFAKVTICVATGAVLVFAGAILRRRND